MLVSQFSYEWDSGPFFQLAYSLPSKSRAFEAVASTRFGETNCQLNRHQPGHHDTELSPTTLKLPQQCCVPSHPCTFVGVGIQDTSSNSECCVSSRLRVGEHFATLCGEPATGGFFKFWKNLPPVTVYPLWIASSSQRWNSCDPHSLFYTWQVHNSTFLYSQISPYIGSSKKPVFTCSNTPTKTEISRWFRKWA